VTKKNTSLCNSLHIQNRHYFCS